LLAWADLAEAVVNGPLPVQLKKNDGGVTYYSNLAGKSMWASVVAPKAAIAGLAWKACATSCTIDVAASIDVDMNDGNLSSCSVSVKSPVVMVSNALADTKITWVLKDDSTTAPLFGRLRFHSANGIDSLPVGAGQFKDAVPSATGADTTVYDNFSITDVKSADKSFYKYSIKIERRFTDKGDWLKCGELDPIIVNTGN
jgi:hypothetical protein